MLPGNMLQVKSTRCRNISTLQNHYSRVSNPAPVEERFRFMTLRQVSVQDAALAGA
jgi:hypothetical protein